MEGCYTPAVDFAQELAARQLLAPRAHEQTQAVHLAASHQFAQLRLGAPCRAGVPRQPLRRPPPGA